MICFLVGCSPTGITEGIPADAFVNGRLIPPPPPPSVGSMRTKHVSTRTLKQIEKLKKKEEAKATNAGQ
jgi:hypothetical protein